MQKKLEAVEADDARVEQLIRRTERVVRKGDRALADNNFALTVRKALGAQ